MNIHIYDNYEASDDLIYKGDSLKEARKAIRERISETCGECDLNPVITGGSSSERNELGLRLYRYIEEQLDNLFAEC